jgi:hypothetical protein
MKKLACLLASVFLACGAPALADEFKNVKCGADIPKALIGQRSANERIMVTEGKYRSLGLKHLGADETSDQLSSINWLICGAEYIMLVDRKGLVRDAIAFPSHSKTSPAFSSYCKLNGKELPDIFVGVLNAEGAGDQLPALHLWKIDLKAREVQSIPSTAASELMEISRVSLSPSSAAPPGIR